MNRQHICVDKSFRFNTCDFLKPIRFLSGLYIARSPMFVATFYLNSILEVNI